VQRFLLDSNVYDDLIGAPPVVDALVELRRRRTIEPLIETHVQRDELARKPELLAARDALPAILFMHTRAAAAVWGASRWGEGHWTVTPTSEFVLGVSRLDEARLGNGQVLEAIRGDTRRENLNHARDALLMDTARAEGAVFVTNERRLLNRGTQLGLDVWPWARFRDHIDQLLPEVTPPGA
jgi:hypothetical protein